MISIAFIVLVAGIVEIRAMRRDKNNRGLFLFIALAGMTLVLGYFYFSKGLNDSFANLFFEMMKISY